MNEGKLFDIKPTVRNGINLETNGWLENEIAMHNEIPVLPCGFNIGYYSENCTLEFYLVIKLNCEISRKMEIGKY